MSAGAPNPAIVVAAIFMVVLVAQYVVVRNFDYKCANCGQMTWATRVPKAK